MKKKVITALLITMTLTLGTVGTVFAMDNDVASGETGNDVNMIKEGFIWVVDKEAWTETIEHPAEYKDVWVVDKEAWTETINHPAEYKDVWVVDKPAWTETVTKYKYVCRCGAEFATVADWIVHNQHFVEQDDFSHGGYSNVPYEETINHPEEGHTEKELVKEAWTETINHPEEGHWEPVKDDETKPENPDEEKPENPDQKPDEETPENPEQKPDEETPENPDQKPDEETPENPEQKPDEETPENPEQKPDEETPENPEQKPDAEKPETPEQKPEEQKKPEQESKKEDTNTAPKTGDPTNLAYLATLAGSALVGGASLKFRKRK